MTEPGMEAVLAELTARPDESETGKGDPLAFRKTCECGGPEDVDKPPIKRGKLPAVPLKRRGAQDVSAAASDPRQPWFLTGSNLPKPCLRCGSRDHKDHVDD